MKAKRIFRLTSITVGILLVLAAVALMLFDMHSRNVADKEKQMIIEKLNEVMPPQTEGVFDEAADANAPMPTFVIGKKGYVGVVSVPELDVTLPVSAESHSAFPVRISGNAVAGSLAISGNLSDIKNISIGQEVVLHDVKGRVWRYTVTDILRNSKNVDNAAKLTFHFISGGADITVICS